MPCSELLLGCMQTIFQRLLNDRRQLVRYQLFHGFFCFFGKAAVLLQAVLHKMVVEPWVKLVSYILTLFLVYFFFHVVLSYKHGFSRRVGIFSCVCSIAGWQNLAVNRVQVSFEILQGRSQVSVLRSSCYVNLNLFFNDACFVIR